MTLIEILVSYKNLVSSKGRGFADSWLADVTGTDLLDHIKASVSDTGDFIDAEGYTFHPSAH